MNDTNLNSALALASRSFAVFPLQPGLKTPYPGTRGFLDATADPEVIRRWFAVPGAEQSNIAIRPAPDVLVVDIDPRHNGHETLRALEAQQGALPDTLTARTGGGGLHAFFRVPADRAWPANLDAFSGPGIDLKGHFSYIVAAPSLHESGRRYEWVNDLPIADAPPWLLALGRPRGERVTVVVEDEEDRTADDTTLGQIVALLEPHFVEGKKHHIAKNLGGWMRQRGFGPGDVRHVIERLPSKNPQARAKAAVAAFGIERAFGFQELQGLIGAANVEALDNATPNPRRAAQLEERASAEGMAAAMGRAAVQAAPLVQVVAAMAPATPQLADPPVAADPWDAWASEIDLTREPPEMPWVIRDLEIGPGRPTAIMAFANGAKTPFALALAVGIASGKPVLNMSVVPGRVAYFCYEATRITHRKVLRIARGLGASIENLSISRMHKLLTEPGALEALLARVKQRQYSVVFVDTYSSAISNIDHNSADFALVLRMLERVSDETGVTFVVLFHSKKDQSGELSDLSGHNSAAAAVQVVLGLARPDPADKTLIEVTCVRELDRAFAPFRVRFVDVAGDALQLVRVGEPPATAEPKAALLVEPLVELVRENCGHIGLSKEAIEELGKERGWARDTVRAAIGLAEARGEIEPTGAGRGRSGKQYMAHPKGDPRPANAYAPPSIKPPRVPDELISKSLDTMGATLRAANDGGAK